MKPHSGRIPRPRRGRRFTGALLVLSVASSLAWAILSREALRESWYVYRMKFSGQKERVAAVQTLGDMGSLMALEELLRMARRSPGILNLVAG